MRIDEIIGVSFFMGFALWLILLPNTVIKFYSWFHNQEVKLKTRHVRNAGFFWLVLVIVLEISALMKKK
ncbi:hypothetical protein [Ferruginibacter albus]|uniref:hypothetical protein n=1 Tax=Ferruginibacter albus TaxID=2875540 RepID=UPI001CC3BB54|nr:hypothetical protein [Ferruginibacter albus]UAY52700.1 hypothetical protein K9M53_03165 [Ferruginibacter albus]